MGFNTDLKVESDDLDVDRQLVLIRQRPTAKTARPANQLRSIIIYRTGYTAPRQRQGYSPITGFERDRTERPRCLLPFFLGLLDMR